MAAKLLKAGHQVTVYNRFTRQRRNPSFGKARRRHAAEASSGAVVFSMFSDYRAGRGHGVWPRQNCELC
ncbi:hypothetical protein [Mycobacterium leprae]